MSIFDSGVSIRLVVRGVQAGDRQTDEKCSFLMKSGWLSVKVFWSLVESPLCVVDLVLILCGRAAVRSQFSVDGRGDAAAVLVVVGQRQVQQAGAGGQVDVLHVLHLRPTHGTQLRERERRELSIEDLFIF